MRDEVEYGKMGVLCVFPPRLEAGYAPILKKSGHCYRCLKKVRFLACAPISKPILYYWYLEKVVFSEISCILVQ